MREPPVTRREFQKLAELRTNDAAALLQKGQKQGAYYLAGYAVECALKAVISRETRRHEFPPKAGYVRDVYSHNLNQLLRLSGLATHLDTDKKTNPALEANWAVVKDWNEESRYKISGLSGKDIYHALVGPDGVLTWIKKYW